jgi:hypothetical protein
MRLDACKNAGIVVGAAFGGRSGEDRANKKARNESSQYGQSEGFVHCVLVVM